MIEKKLFEEVLENFLEQVQELSFYEKLNNPEILRKIILEATWVNPNYKAIEYVRECLIKNLNKINSFEYFMRLCFECLKRSSQHFTASNIYYIFDHLFNWRTADRILDEHDAFSQLDRLMYQNFSKNKILDVVFFLIKKKASFLKNQIKPYLKKIKRENF